MIRRYGSKQKKMMIVWDKTMIITLLRAHPKNSHHIGMGSDLLVSSCSDNENSWNDCRECWLLNSEGKFGRMLDSR